MYRVSIELYKHEWKFGRTRNAVGKHDLRLILVYIIKLNLENMTWREKRSWTHSLLFMF